MFGRLGLRDDGFHGGPIGEADACAGRVNEELPGDVARKCILVLQQMTLSV